MTTKIGLINPQPKILAASRIGSSYSVSEGKCRTVKITVTSLEVVKRIFSVAHKLKEKGDMLTAMGTGRRFTWPQTGTRKRGRGASETGDRAENQK